MGFKKIASSHWSPSAKVDAPESRISFGRFGHVSRRKQVKTAGGTITPIIRHAFKKFLVVRPHETMGQDTNTGKRGYRCLFFWLLGPAFIGNFLLLSVRSALRGKFYFPSSSRSRADVSRLLPECLRVSDRASRVPSLSIEPCIMILIVVVVNLTKKLIFGSTGGKLSDL